VVVVSSCPHRPHSKSRWILLKLGELACASSLEVLVASLNHLVEDRLYETGHLFMSAGPGSSLTRNEDATALVELVELDSAHGPSHRKLKCGIVALDCHDDANALVLLVSDVLNEFVHMCSDDIADLLAVKLAAVELAPVGYLNCPTIHASGATRHYSTLSHRRNRQQ
jgi:hypothetical protein